MEILPSTLNPLFCILLSLSINEKQSDTRMFLQPSRKDIYKKNEKNKIK